MTFLAVPLTPEVVGSVFKVHLQETVIKIHCRGLFNTRSGVLGTVRISLPCLNYDLILTQ